MSRILLVPDEFTTQATQINKLTLHSPPPGRAVSRQYWQISEQFREMIE